MIRFGGELERAVVSGDSGVSMVLDQHYDVMAIIKIDEVVCPDVPSCEVRYGSFAFYNYRPEGPVVRLSFQLHDRPGEYLEGDYYMNPSSAEDRSLLTRMAFAEEIYIVVVTQRGERLHYVLEGRVPWGEQQRKAARKVMGCTVGTETIWPAARERCEMEYMRGF